ncbi:MAG TPA: VCBS repeat-containing protein [Bryobacteraceae bacterium]
MLSSHLRHYCGAGFIALLCASPLVSQTFAPPKHYGPFTDSYQLATGDFNRDGAADFVGAANFNNGTQTEVVVYMNSGGGTFGTPSVVSGSVGAGNVAVGDFNQDGNLDIAFTAPNSQVGVAYGNGKGGFGSPHFYSVKGAPNSIAVADYNGDGKADIATLSNSTKEVTVLTNTGTSFTSSSFTVPLYYSSNNSGYPPDNVGSLVSGDFNGNHKQDLAYLDICTDSACGPGLSRIYTLINTGSGSSFTPNLLNDQVSYTAELDAADVDLDGKVDLLVSTAGGGTAAAFVEYSNGNNSFTQVFFDDYDPGSGQPLHMVVGDFNNDGIEDIAGYTQIAPDGVTVYGFDVYTGKGGRSFNPAVHIADNTNVSPRGGFAAGFIDQNGTKDIALVDTTGLAIFLNTTSTAKDPCSYLTTVGIHNCGPANGSSGAATIHVLDSYRSSVQPAARIEFWADGKKLFQEYQDFLSTYVTLSKGTHQLSVVGVDATGKYIKSNTTYTVQ